MDMDVKVMTRNRLCVANEAESCASDESETLVGSQFLTSFEAPEFSGRIRTDLLPSSVFLHIIQGGRSGEADRLWAGKETTRRGGHT